MKDAEEKPLVFDRLHRGSQYRLKCMMEHEMRHAMHEGRGMRRLSEEEGSETEFATQSDAGGRAERV